MNGHKNSSNNTDNDNNQNIIMNNSNNNKRNHNDDSRGVDDKVKKLDEVEEDVGGSDGKGERRAKVKDEPLRTVDTRESAVERFTSCRWVLAYMSSLMTLLVMCLRHCLSMAIVCMSHAQSATPTATGEAGSARSSNNDTANGTTGGAAAVTAFEWTTTETGKNGSWWDGAVTSSPGDGLSNRTWDSDETFSPMYISDDMQGLVLSSYYYGYVATSLIGGLIAMKVGPKRSLTIAMGMSAVLTLLTPVVVRFNIYLTVVLRAALGLVSGVAMPAVVSMWAFWAPTEEKAVLLTVTFAGSSTGNIVANFVSGFLCSIPLDEGWPFIFYTYGFVTAAWVVVWHFVAFDTPEEHPRIKGKERVRIRRRRSSHPNASKVPKLPLKAAFTSPAFLSLAVTHMSYTWFLGTMSTYIPIYFNDVLRFNTEVTGMLSSLPFVVRVVFSMMFAVLADRITTKGWLSVTLNRKLFQCAGLVIPGILVICVGFLTPDLKFEAVTLMIFVASFQSACMSGFRINHLDIAPRFAGSLSGITVSFATASNIISPVIVSSMIADKQQASWRNVFILTAVLAFIGALLFAVFGSGEEQEWAKERPEKSTASGVAAHQHSETSGAVNRPTDFEIEIETQKSSRSSLDNGRLNVAFDDEDEMKIVVKM